ncbi:MAG: phosphomannomutase/phosphoglucomutase [Candidatus Aenigmatarchaeota archaeon]
MSVFRKYDFRGIYPSELDEKKAKKIAKAFVEVKGLPGKRIAVGRDIRRSSPKISEAVVEGIREQGCDVVDIGETATPVLYYEVVEDNLDGGAMVTASHNPKEYTGVRFCEEKGLDLTYEAGIKEMEEVHDSDFVSRERGSLAEKDVHEGFLEKVASSVSLEKEFKVVLDPGNGSASLFAEGAFERLGCKVEMINSKVDGTFPARGPDPVENIGELGDVVVDKDADLGIAFDGDGDRGVFVDEEGKRVENDILLALFVKNFAGENDVIVHDVKSSKVVEDIINEINAQDVSYRVGMSYIKREMVERGAELGGEYTGHFFFRDNDYYDDPFYAAAKLLEVMDEKGKLSEIVKELPEYHSSPEIRLACSNKEQVPQKLKEEFSEQRIVSIDGAKIYFEDGWALVRPSGTEDKISLRFEAETEEKLKEIKENVMDKVEDYIKD